MTNKLQNFGVQPSPELIGIQHRGHLLRVFFPCEHSNICMPHTLCEEMLKSWFYLSAWVEQEEARLEAELEESSRGHAGVLREPT